MTHPFAAQRALFPSLAHRVQLSSCSQSALAAPVAEAAQAFLGSWHEKGMDWGGWMQAVHAAKASFARLINAREQDIALLGSVSDIASSVGSALSYPPERSRIVLAELDFPSLGHVWLAQQARGAQVRFVDGDGEGGVDPRAYEREVDDHTAVVSVSHVAYANGFRQDLRAVGDIARRHGALLFVDAYQSAGAVHIDVQRDPVDVLAAGAQKFLLGTPGLAFMYVRPEVAARLRPTNTGWFGRVDPFAFDIHRLDYAAGAARFDTGTPSMLAAHVCGAGLALLTSVSPLAVEQYLGELSRVAMQEADRLGLPVVSPRDPARKAATTAIRVGDAARLEREMAARGYVVSARNDVIRVAPHFYNSEADVVEALRTLAQLR